MNEDLLITLVYFGLAIPFIWLERKYAARKVEHRRVLARDVAAYVFTSIGGALIGIGLAKVPGPWWTAMAVMPVLPVWAIAICTLLLGDFTLYWIHRAMHTRWLWPSHRWHHAVEHMYWFSGSRASLIHGAFYTIPSFWMTMFQAPPVLYFLGLGLSTITNHWMHANVRFDTRSIEWLIISPRAHHVHHSNALEHRDRNFGGLFSIWDRMFGTYVDPATVRTEELSFGIAEQKHPVRLFLGI